MALLAGALVFISPLSLANNRSSTIAISPDGELLAAVNNDSRSVTLVSLPGHEVLVEIIVGRDPRNVAFMLEQDVAISHVARIPPGRRF